MGIGGITLSPFLTRMKYLFGNIFLRGYEPLYAF